MLEPCVIKIKPRGLKPGCLKPRSYRFGWLGQVSSRAYKGEQAFSVLYHKNEECSETFSPPPNQGWCFICFIWTLNNGPIIPNNDQIIIRHLSICPMSFCTGYGQSNCSDSELSNVLFSGNT